MVDYKMVDGVKLPLTNEEQGDHDARIIAYPAIAANQAIKKQINALEATQTLRRMREGGQWMIDLNNQIVALRVRLT